MKTNYLEVVEQLNQELYDKHKEQFLVFTLVSTGDWSGIKFGDYCIWDTENNEREWIYEEEDYEPLLPYIKKLFNSHIKHLSKLKL